MKLFLILLCCFPGFFSIAQPVVKSINDFGGKANDNISDQAAFNAAATFINTNKGGVRLIIPAGQYIVGPEYDYKTELKKMEVGRLWDVFNIKNCKEVSIEGQGRVVIKFKDGIPFGATEKLNGNKEISVHIGSLFRIINCKDVKIKNILADGNLPKFRLLVPYGIGQKPYERENEGLFILNCVNMAVENCDFINFGRDGCMVLQDTDKMPVDNLSFTNCSFDLNGRNGFSWCGGKNFTFTNCRFNNNSKGNIQTNPGAGLDIEPERDAECRNGKFLNCSFINNGGYAITSAYEAAMDVKFDSCRIIGNTNYALYTLSPRFIFSNSLIAGCAMFYCNMNRAPDATRIFNCVFTDSVKGQVIKTPTYLAAVIGRFTKFEKCDFNSYYAPALYLEVKNKAPQGREDNVAFEHCNFNAFFKKPGPWGNRVLIGGYTSFNYCNFFTAGFPDYKLVFSETWRYMHLTNNSFPRKPIFIMSQ